MRYEICSDRCYRIHLETFGGIAYTSFEGTTMRAVEQEMLSRGYEYIPPTVGDQLLGRPPMPGRPIRTELELPCVALHYQALVRTEADGIVIVELRHSIESSILCFAGEDREDAEQQMGRFGCVRITTETADLLDLLRLGT